MSNSPDALWQPTGTYPSGSVARLEVRICLDNNGQVWSFNHPLLPEDERQFTSWPGCGVRAITHALLVEALRREAYLCFLTGMTRDADLLNKYVNGDESAKAEIERQLTAAVTEVVLTTTPRIAPDAVREILSMASLQVRVP